MELFLGMLAVLAPCWLVVGLIKPSWALRWGKKRTRLRVFGWFLLFILMFSVLMAIYAPAPMQPAPQTEQAAPTQSASVALDAEAYKAYCSYVREFDDLARDLDFAFGFDPAHGRQPGEVITLEIDLVGTATPTQGSRSGDGVVKYFSGTKIKILERHFYGKHSPDLLYQVEGKGVFHLDGRTDKGVVVGYVEPSALKLRSDEKRNMEFIQRHTAMRDEVAEVVKEKHAAQLTPEIEVKAMAEDWWGKCLREDRLDNPSPKF